MARAGKSLRKVGHCIYCGATDTKLTDEHIIPFALGGNLKLDSASCGNCQRATSSIEHHVCRPIAGMLRTRLQIQTRRPRKRELVSHALKFGEEWRQVQMPPEEFPSTLSYPVFAPPRILQPRASIGAYAATHLWSLGQDDNFKAVADAVLAKYGADSLKLAEFKPAILMNFVAKVAHSAAVALLGPESFTPFLRRIAVQPEQVSDFYLGGGGEWPVQPSVLHHLELFRIDTPTGSLIVFRLTWFASLKPPLDQLKRGEPITAPPSFMAVVGRPKNDILRGKLAYITIKSDCDADYGFVEIPLDLMKVARPIPRKS